jgi:hypothetical protein
MEFKSKINYFLIVARVIFIIACLFFLALSFSSFAFSKNLFGNILIKIIAAVGMFWGIYVTIRGLIFRTRIVVITNDQLIIRDAFRERENVYEIKDIKAIATGTAYDMGNYSNGIKLRFKNGDTYEFIWYDYLNFGKMKTAFNELKKISEKSFI